MKIRKSCATLKGYVWTILERCAFHLTSADIFMTQSDPVTIQI